MCLRPAGARAAVRPNIDAKSAPPGTEFGGCGGGGRRPLFPPDTPPAPLAAAAVSAGSTWSWAGRGALRLRLLCGGASGCAGGRGRRQGAGAASPGVRGVWGPGVRLRAIRPLPATPGAGRRCSPSCRCHQPAEAGPPAGRGHTGPAPPAAGKSSAAPAARPVRRPGRSVQSNFACVLAGCARSFSGLRAYRVNWGGPGSQTLELGAERASLRRGALPLEPAAARDQMPSRCIPAAITLPI